MTLDELLRAAAEDVASRSVDADVDAARIRARALKIRQRRRVGAAGGAAVATALVAVGLQAVGGGRAAPDPIDPPSPTPSPSVLGRSEPIVTIPEIAPGDLREYDELATVTNAQAEGPRLTELVFDVPVRDRFAFEYSFFCTGDPETWYVLIVGDTGASAYGFCDQPPTQPFPSFPEIISPLDHSGGEEATLSVRMFVTGPLPQEHERCFVRQSPTDCQDKEPPLEPLESTDVTFGVSIYEYWAPAVAEFGEERISARASADGVDHVLSRVLESTPGQDAFSTTLPAIDTERLVTVLTTYTDAGITCASEAPSQQEADACFPEVELSIGDRTVLLGLGKVGDVERLSGRHGFYRVPAGERRLEVRVASGDPEHVQYALLVFDKSL